MTVSMYSMSAPVFVTMLNNLSHILDIAQKYADEKKFDSSVFMHARLAPDMFPFPRQIGIACDSAKFLLARLSGVEAPRFADEEKSIAELKERIKKTLDFIHTITPAQINGTEEKSITFPVGPDKHRTMKGEDYLKTWVLPNIYFHISIAYAILRHNGVPLGKLDYLVGAQR